MIDQLTQGTEHKATLGTGGKGGLLVSQDRGLAVGPRTVGHIGHHVKTSL